MISSMSIMEIVLESSYKGLIYINEEGKVGAYSRLAKEITGIVLESNKRHSGGQISEGDIIVIADNEIGNDDALGVGDLETINIHDKNIELGQAIIAIGVYKNKKIEPIYKFVKDYNPNGSIRIEENYLGFYISAYIDFAKCVLGITVNGANYNMNYFDSIGHMVVIDGITGDVKFFQARGYGFRGEEIGKLLRGKKFLPKPGKGDDGELIPTIGAKYKEIIYGDKIVKDISEMLDCQEICNREGVYEIHKRNLYCILVRIKKHGENNGIYLVIQDANHLENVIEERNKIIHILEQQKKKKSYIGMNEPELPQFKTFIGSDPSMNEVKQLAYKASKTKFNVIITGESGTGKSRLAREIHDMSNREAPFVEVNCNAIAPSLIESELFGYVGGAFTGAASSGKPGYFEEANGGTIFLDEIGEIPLDIQVKLLQVLQNKKIYRVGSSKPVDVDVRVITATNKKLEDEVIKGNFRQDLYYRINVFPICIPPLRQRKGDLYILINSILDGICKRYYIEHKQLSEEALNKMLSYNWPGNVRELENVIERAITICESPVIYSEHIMVGEKNRRILTLKEQVEKEELRIICETLRKNHNNRQKTIEELGISKTAFYEKMKKGNVL